MVPYQWKALNDDVAEAEPSHAIENSELRGQSEGEFYGMVFQDSDVAKGERSGICWQKRRMLNGKTADAS